MTSKWKASVFPLLHQNRQSTIALHHLHHTSRHCNKATAVKKNVYDEIRPLIGYKLLQQIFLIIFICLFRLVSGAAIAWSICNSPPIKFIFYIIWYPTRYSNSVYSSCKFVCIVQIPALASLPMESPTKHGCLPIRCHLPTQLSSGRIIAITLER